MIDYKSDEFEYWKTLKRDSKYEISNHGNLRHKENLICRVWTLNKRFNYYCMTLNSNVSLRRGLAVLESFVEYPNDGKKYSCDHIDRNTKNDRLSNLRWADAHTQNMNKNQKNKSGQRYIRKHGNRWQFYINNSEHNHLKNFKTMELAITYRDAFCNDNNIIIINP